MFIIFSKENCPHCTSAKQILDAAGEEYQETKINGNPNEESSITLDDFKKQYPHVRSAPHIILDGKNLGGLLDLKKHFYEN